MSRSLVGDNGHPGVRREGLRWVAHYKSADGSNHHLGTFDHRGDAVAAYDHFVAQLASDGVDIEYERQRRGRGRARCGSTWPVVWWWWLVGRPMVHLPGALRAASSLTA